MVFRDGGTFRDKPFVDSICRSLVIPLRQLLIDCPSETLFTEMSPSLTG